MKGNRRTVLLALNEFPLFVLFVTGVVQMVVAVGQQQGNERLSQKGLV